MAITTTAISPIAPSASHVFVFDLGASTGNARVASTFIVDRGAPLLQPAD
jgi:hypothetical protein